ncbi:MAG: hypothetical protein K9M82_03915 [Deltaproteobacteria bacterium]|nr:hypothetical protein [Deltaproteobacteria bacterium]
MDQPGSSAQGGGNGMDSRRESFLGLVERRTAGMSGCLAWLNTDLQKKGAARKAERVEHLSERFDRICSRLDAVGRALQGANTGISPSGSEGDAARLEGGLRAELAGAGRLISELTDGVEPFTEERERRLAERFEALESALDEGERLFGVRTNR